MPNVEKSEIFCLAAKGEIFGLRPQVKSNAYAFGEMKSTHPPSRRISLPAGQFHRRMRYHPPVNVNDIRLRRMIYRAYARHDIFAFRKYDIISVPSYAAGVYHPRSEYHTCKVYHPFRRPKGTPKRAKRVLGNERNGYDELSSEVQQILN